MNNIKMTRIAIWIMGVLCLAMAAAGPIITSFVLRRPSLMIQGPSRYWIILGLGYVLAVIAIICLVSLYRLVGRIEKDQIFVEENVRSLHHIALEVGAAAAISLFLGITCVVMMLGVAAMAAFMVLIILVVKNSFERAVAMKDELDLTI